MQWKTGSARTLMVNYLERGSRLLARSEKPGGRRRVCDRRIERSAMIMLPVIVDGVAIEPAVAGTSPLLVPVQHPGNVLHEVTESNMPLPDKPEFMAYADRPGLSRK